MTADCGNQLAMWIKRHTSSALFGALWLMVIWGCAPKLAPTLPGGIALQPGQYVTASYRAPDFNASRAVYALGEFPVQTSQDVDPENFQALFQAELARSFQANGLKVDPQSDTVLSGAVQQVAIRGTSLRFVIGKITAYLTVQGTVTRGEETLFAYQDRIKVYSPLNPGFAAPKEQELLLDQAARIAAAHLLNELLLNWPETEGK